MLARTQSECFPLDRCAVSSVSKTDYIFWRDCAKNAWQRIHKPDVYFSTELTEYEQSVMEMGIEVERVARGLFPDGAVVTGSQTDALQETRALIASNTPTLLLALHCAVSVPLFTQRTRSGCQGFRPSAENLVARSRQRPHG
jgi:hypothetical protein